MGFGPCLDAAKAGMARDRCTDEDVFDILTRISQHQNVRLRDVARTIVDAIANGRPHRTGPGRSVKKPLHAGTTIRGRGGLVHMVGGSAHNSGAGAKHRTAPPVAGPATSARAIGGGDGDDERVRRLALLPHHIEASSRRQGMEGPRCGSRLNATRAARLGLMPWQDTCFCESGSNAFAVSRLAVAGPPPRPAGIGGPNRPPG